MFARDSFWCIANTLKQAGLKTYPYHVYVPSFGEWGFVLAGHTPFSAPTALPDGLRFVTPRVVADMFAFPPDMDSVPTEVNRLDNQVLVRYFESEWGRYLAE